MRNPVRILLASAAVAAMMAMAPPEAMAKCVERIGHPVLPGYLFIVDGQVRGEYAMDEQAPLPSSEQILRMEVACRTASTPQGRPAQQAALFVVTRAGAEAMLKSYLSELAAAQTQHRERTGAYAATAEELDFFATRLAVPMQIVVSGESWTAEVTIEGSGIDCRTGAGHAIPTCSRVDGGAGS